MKNYYFYKLSIYFLITIPLFSTCALNAQAQQVSLTDQNLQIKSVNDQIEISFGKEQMPTPEIIKLDSPGRIVLDFPTKEKFKNQSANAKNSKIIKAIRVGSHPDKVRVVIDLLLDEHVDYKFSQHGASAALSFVTQESEPPTQKESTKVIKEVPKETPTFVIERANKVESENTKPETAPSISPSALATQSAHNPIATEQHKSQIDSPVLKKVGLATPTPTPSKSITLPTASPSLNNVVKEKLEVKPNNPAPSPTRSAQTPTFTPTPSPTPKPTQSPSPSPSPTSTPKITEQKTELQQDLAKPKALISQIEPKPEVNPALALVKISFEYLPPAHNPIIKLSLNGLARFTFQRKDDKLYILTINEAELAANNLSLPYYPPQDFVGMRLVKAETKGKDLEINLGVDHMTKLMAYFKDNAIWIRTLNR